VPRLDPQLQAAPAKPDGTIAVELHGDADALSAAVTAS